MIVEARGLGKVFPMPAGPVTALSDASLRVDGGDYIAIQGPSGCGKSTLLHILGAMERPTSGSVRLGDRELRELGLEELAILRRRRIGFVFQEFNLFPTLTVAENIMLPLTLDGVLERAAKQRARTLVEQVGLTSRWLHYPAQISGGEMQRVAVARAVAAVLSASSIEPAFFLTSRLARAASDWAFDNSACRCLMSSSAAMMTAFDCSTAACADSTLASLAEICLSADVTPALASSCCASATRTDASSEATSSLA